MHFPFALPDHLVPLLSAAWLCYLVVLAAWIVVQQREPVATLSWLLALAALPLLGFLIYYALGPQRIRRQVRRRLRSQAALGMRQPAGIHGGEGLALGRVGTATTDYPMATSTNVRLLVDGAATYDAILEAIAAARHHVHLEYYIFVADRSGTRLRDALVERAKAGVKVRVLLDGVGARLRRRFLVPMLDAGVEVARFHPVRWWLTPFLRPKLNMRSHRKIVICDGAVAFTGGINITDEEDERLDPKAYHDLHLRFEGDAVRWLQVAWLEDWHYATDHALKEPDLFVPACPGTICTQVLPSGPDNPWEPLHRLHVEAIHRAEKRVWLATPYFVPSQAALFALGGAAMRGLDVRIMVPERSDSRLVDACARSYFAHLQKAGIRIYRYGPRLMHAKAMLVDDDVAVIGSANFDSRSFRLNFELSVLFCDKGVATDLEAFFRHDFEVAREIPDRLPKRRFTQRLGEGLARLFSPGL